jgi:hypothetical protein
MRLDVVGFVVGSVGVLVGVVGVTVAVAAHGGDSASQGPVTRVTVTAEPAAGATVTVTAEPAPQPAPTPTTPPPPPASPTPKPLPHRVGDGTYLVGKDIPAGTWRNNGSYQNGGLCVAYASSKPSDISSYLRGSTSKGAAIVMVNKGEYFNVAYCNPFTLE